MARPWVELAGVVGEVNQRVRAAEGPAVAARARATRAIIVNEGNPYRITSHPSGRKVVLGSRVEMTPVGQDAIAVGPIGQLRGAWSIVERGSSPHAILPRGMSRKIRRAQTRASSGKRLQRRQASLLASIVTGDRAGLFAGVKPLGLTRIGPRYGAWHPGHAPIGSPWRKAMERAGVEGRAVFEAEFVARARRRS